MGLTLQALKLMKPYLKGRLLSLGYQDILPSVEEIKELFGVTVEKTTTFGKWHGKKYPLPETEEFFSRIGVEHVCVDIVKARGTEIVCDLNYPLEVSKVYDLVLDGGTLEHCFNVGQAFINAAEAVKVGGHIFHGNPISMVNHGFYMFSPTLYHDFYRQNGWKVLEMVIGDLDVMRIPTGQRVEIDSELTIMVVAQRLSEGPLKFPTQSKYLKNPTLQ
jgi:hypothetical protein